MAVMATRVQMVIDCADPGRLAAFWALALNYREQPPPDGFGSWEDALRAWNVPEDQWNSRSAVIDPDGVGPRLFFQQVPEGKVVKNRVHLDINASEGTTDPGERRLVIASEVQRLTDAGASVVHEMEERGEFWVVMQDPEGNEFCVQ
jgi:hypothetical protein